MPVMETPVEVVWLWQLPQEVAAVTCWLFVVLWLLERSTPGPALE